jgi:hypothetical protein
MQDADELFGGLA